MRLSPFRTDYHPPPRMRKKNREINEKLSQLVQELEANEIPLKAYIRRAANTLHENGSVVDEAPGRGIVE